MKRKANICERVDIVKKSKLITFGLSFRNVLNTENAINALHDLVQSSVERDVVTEYINAGGSATEIVKLLKRFDGKKDFIVANTVFSAVRIIILKTLDDLLLLQKNVEEACEELLSSYLPTMQNMLGSDAPTGSHKKVVLELLTGMITLSNGLAKKILTSFSMNPKLLRSLTDARCSTSSRKLRTCFIHYLISFLISDNSVLITELLNKKGLLTSIMPGLINDQPSTVALVLNTLRTKIVENVRISKTAKIHTFNTHVLGSIYKLYDYKISSDVNDNEPEVIVQSIREAAHSLLVLLCTSSKKGILFREKHSVSGSSSNQLILTLLEYIEAPWKDELKCELVLEILKVCPEFSKNIFERLEPYLQPSTSPDWIKLITYMKRIIEERVFNVEMNHEQQILIAIVSWNFPPVIQKLLCSVSDVVHPDPVIRYEIISLFRSILRKIKIILADCKKTLRVEEFLLKNLIPSRHLINAWNAGIDVILVENVSRNENDEHLNHPSASCYFNTLADLLLLYETLCPSYFNLLHVDKNIRLADVDIDCPDFQFKRAELIFRIYNPKPSEDQFRFMMTKFIECYILDSGTTPNKVLQDVFLKTGFFDEFGEEILIWLYSIKKVGFRHPAVVSSLLVDTFSSVAQKCKKWLQDLAIIRQECDVLRKDLNLPQNIEYFLDLSEEQISKSSVLLSPLVPAFLSVLKSYEELGTKDENTKIIKSFASHFLVHLLHLQNNGHGLLKIVNEYKNSFVDSCFYDYVSFWISGKIKLKRFKYPLTDEDAFLKWSQQIIKGDAVCEAPCIFAEASETERVLMWNLCIFYICQLNSHNLLDSKNITNYVTCLKTILKNLQSENAFLSLKSLLISPGFIDSFFSGNDRICSPLSRIAIDVSLDFISHLAAVPDSYSTLLSPYRSRFVLFLLNEKEQRRNFDINSLGCEIEKVFQFVALPDKTAIRLLNSFSQLPIRLLVNEDKNCLSGWNIVIQQLLKIVAKNLETPMEKENFCSLLNVLPQLLKLNIAPDSFEESLIDYLKSFPHHLHHISSDFVVNMINYHPKVDKLALFLLPYFSENFPALRKKIIRNIRQLDTGTLLKVAHQTENKELILSVICKHFLNELTNWSDEHCSQTNDVALVATIFRDFVERKVCSKLCKKIESEWQEMNLNTERCVVFRAVFEKAGKISRYVELLISMLQQVPSESTNWISLEICDAVNMLDAIDFMVNRELLQEFVKLSLNNGLQTSNVTLIRVVKTICQKLSDLDDLNIVFQTMFTHSQFVGFMLGDSSIKHELIQLFSILTKKSTSLMSSNHVPLLLGAYKAMLSEVDQMLLELLQSYEDNEIRFTDCRPYFWGDAAITHHNIREEISVSLKRLPQPNQVLDLLDVDVVQNTIRYFPVNRGLRPEKYENSIPVEVYDPCFILPLFSHLLAPESRISIRKFTRSGALSLLVMALSSHIPIVRTAACHCLQRFSFHLTSREKEVQIWNHFLNALKSGISAVTSEDDTPPQLASIAATFMARMCLIISEPLHTLYAPLTNFLLAKPVFDVNTIPNFLILFYSTDMKSREYQEWILSVIRDGMRGKLDWLIAQKSYLFKLSLQLYSTAVSSETTDTLILEIIANALQIRECKLHLLTKCALMSWISQIIRQTSEYRKQFFPSVIKMLKSASMKKSSGVIDVILLLITKLVSKKMDRNRHHVEELITVFSNTYCSCKNENVLDERDIELVITFASPFLDVKREKQLRNCLIYKSVLGITEECEENLTNYVIRILNRFIKGSSIVT